MSLSTAKVKLDDLPSERFLSDPLRSRVSLNAQKVAAPAQRNVVARMLPGGRPAPPAPPPANGRPPPRSSRVSEDDEDEEDDDDDDGSDSSNNATRRRNGRRVLANRSRQPTNTSHGPFTIDAKTNVVSLTFGAGFRDLCGTVSKQAASVTIKFPDIVKSADSPELASKFASYDPTRAVPITVSVLGTSLGDNERHCVLEIYDACNKPLFSKFLQKTNSADASSAGGYPLFLLRPTGDNTIMLNAPALTAEHKSYWAFNLETLEKNTSDFRHPVSGEAFKIIRKNSKCAALMDYALSVKNTIIRPRLLENDNYTYAADKDLIQLPLDLFNRTVAAYKRKLATVQSTSFDLSSVRVCLKLLDLSRELDCVDPKNVSGVVAVRIEAHIALKPDNGQETDVSEYVSKTAITRGDTSDESDDDDEDL